MRVLVSIEYCQLSPYTHPHYTVATPRPRLRVASPDIELCKEDILARQTSSSQLKRSLETAFGPIVEQIRMVKQKKEEEKFIVAEQFSNTLAAVGQGCGACWSHNIFQTHSQSTQCPYIDVGSYGLLSHRIKYPVKSQVAFDEFGAWTGPCYACHIHSLGSNTLHPPFKKGNCPNPNLIVPLLTCLWDDHNRRNLVAQHFGTTWTDIMEYAKWLSLPQKGYFTTPMQVLHWWMLRLEGLDDIHCST